MRTALDVSKSGGTLHCLNIRRGPPFIKGSNQVSQNNPSDGGRRPRADAKRNRAKLVEAAKRVFADRGATASLEQVARDAGVGIGTLYRHFPTRDLLIEAVYQQETDRLVEAASELAATKAPVEALREWLRLFVDFLEAKQDLKAVLEALIGGSEALYSGTPARLSPPIDMLVERIEATGLRLDIAPLDLLRAIVGVGTVRPGSDWKPRAIRLIDLLLRGARTTS